MKSVMISIQPKWCELIALGNKTVEVRKTRPKIEAPFKCYIYCTKTKTIGDFILCKSKENAELFGLNTAKGINKGFAQVEDIHLNGKVIGEFVCDDLEMLFDTNGNPKNYMAEILPDILKRTALTYKEFQLYVNGRASKNSIYGWHISDLVVYDKPKELSEFCISDNSAIQSCEHRQITGQPEYKTAHNGWIKGSYICNKSGELTWCEKCKTKPLTRPPQSWCYVVEKEGAE